MALSYYSVSVLLLWIKLGFDLNLQETEVCFAQFLEAEAFWQQCTAPCTGEGLIRVRQAG